MISKEHRLVCVWFVVAVVIGTTSGIAQAEPCFGSSQELGQWFTSYYQNPEPHKLFCSLEYITQSNDSRFEERVWSTMSFYAAALESSETARVTFMRQISASSSSEIRTLAVVAFFLMNPSVGKPLLEQANSEWGTSPEGEIAVVLQESVPENFLPKTIESGSEAIQAADVLDSCWMAFMGSGEPGRLLPVVQAAKWILLEKSPRQVVGQTAVWSLSSNAATHPRVRAYLAQHLVSADKSTRMVISEIIRGLEPEGAGPESGLSWKSVEAGLQVALVVTDKPNRFFEAWQKKDGKIPMGSCERVEKGIPVVTAVVISHCPTDSNGQCNLTADFVLKRPDGTEHAKNSAVDLWVGKPAPPEKSIVLGTGYMGIVFEPDDTLGIHTIVVTVHDLNSGAVLELTHTITVAERGISR